MVYETKIPRQHSASTVTEDCSDDSEVTLSDISGVFFVNRCCSVQLAPVLTTVSCDPGSADPDIRGLCSGPPVQDPDLRPALCCHLLSQVRLRSLSVHLAVSLFL